MENATITNNEQPISQERFPSVVTMDDLIFELGKNVVEKLNKEKLLEGLLTKKRQVESQIVDVEKIKVDTKKQISALENSNKQYEENNRNLDDELVKVRQDLTNEIDKNAQLVSSFDTEKTRLIEQYKKRLEELTLNLEEAKSQRKSGKKGKRK